MHFGCRNSRSRIISCPLSTSIYSSFLRVDPRQAHKPPERGIVVFGTPDERKSYSFILFAHGPEDDAWIGHSAPVLGYKTDAEPETHKVHDPFTAEPMASHTRPPSEIGQSADQILLDFGTRLGRADQEPSLPDVIPRKLRLIL